MFNSKNPLRLLCNTDFRTFDPEKEFQDNVEVKVLEIENSGYFPDDIQRFYKMCLEFKPHVIFGSFAAIRPDKPRGRGNIPFHSEFFEKYCPKELKMISLIYVGYDSVDIKLAGEKGVIVTNTKGSNSKATAEMAMWLILTLFRKVNDMRSDIIKGEFRPKIGMSLENRVLGIVGLGDIGRALLTMAQLGFGMKIVYYKRTRLSKTEETSLGIEYLALNDLLARSDVVSLHVPYNEKTHGMFGSAQFQRMKPTAFFINTARGKCVDEDALITALKQKTIAGAGLDVYCTEPCPPERLKELGDAGCCCTPHVGGGSDQSMKNMENVVLSNVKKLACGEKPINIVNEKHL